MSFYPILVFIHVALAVLGLGPLTAAAVLTTWSANFPPRHIQTMLRIVSIGLAGILATGVAIIAMTHGALGETRWMKIAFALFLLLGLLHGIVSYQFRRAPRGGKSAMSSSLLAGMLWAMCGIVVAITYLMEVKPS